jgi:hypothetical protein
MMEAMTTRNDSEAARQPPAQPPREADASAACCWPDWRREEGKIEERLRRFAPPLVRDCRP